MNNLKITKKWFDGKLSSQEELADAHFVRRQVFMLEQNVSEEEEMIRDEDINSHHLVFYSNDEPIATGRILFKSSQVFLGRIAVLKQFRGCGIGLKLTQELINKTNQLGVQTLHIHSQTYALDFYKKLGFEPFGEEFLDAGIKHYNMKLEIKQ